MMILVPVTLLRESVVSSIPELYSRGQIADLERMLRTSATVAAAPALVLLFSLVVVPQWALLTVFGPGYAASSGTLVILALGQIVVVLAGNCQVSLMMTGNERSIAMLNAVTAVMLLVGGAFAARYFGTMGLALASAGTTALRCICAWWWTRQCVGVWTHPSLKVSFPWRLGKQGAGA